MTKKRKFYEKKPVFAPNLRKIQLKKTDFCLVSCF